MASNNGTVNKDQLDSNLSPEEIEQLDFVDEKQMKTTESPFSFMINNWKRGGGRKRKKLIHGN